MPDQQVQVNSFGSRSGITRGECSVTAIEYIVSGARCLTLHRHISDPPLSWSFVCTMSQKQFVTVMWQWQMSVADDHSIRPY